MTPIDMNSGSSRPATSSAFTALIRKEVQNNLRNQRFAFAYVVVTVLLVGSFAILLSDFLQEHRTWRANSVAAAGESSNWMNPPPAYREPLVTKILAVGSDRDAEVRLDASSWIGMVSKGDFRKNPMGSLFPTLDLVFVTGVILSLLIFVLTFDAVSGEREGGTLKVLLSCPVPRDQIILAKWIGGFLSLVLPFLTSALVMVLLLLMSPGVSATPETWIRIGLIFALCVLYIAVIFSASLFVSASVRSSSSSILILLFAWVVLILVLPSASAPVAGAIISPPGTGKSQLEMAVAVQKGFHGRDSNTTQKILQEEFGGRTLDALNPQERRRFHNRNFQAVVFSYIDFISAKHSEFLRSQNRMDALALWICRLSPYGCLQNAAVSLARTGTGQENAILTGYEKFGRDYIRYSMEGWMKMDEAGVRGDAAQAQIAAYAPKFSMPRLSLSRSLADCLVDISILGMMVILFFLGAYARFLRMDVT